MNDLNDLFRQLSEAKAQDPKYQKVKKLEEQVKESVKADLGSLFSELSALKAKRNEIIEQNPELVKEEFIQEVAPIETPIGEVPPEQQSPAVADLPELDKWLRTPKHEPTSSENDFAVINKKIKLLEQWIGKIDNAGPGSGEVNFRYLDDVNRDTMNPGNDNWVLEYDAASKKVQFTTNIGPIQTIIYDPTHVDDHTEEGTTAWSNKDRTLNIHHPGGVIQQVGQEQYMLVRNLTGSTIPNGTCVRFDGAVGTDGEARIITAPLLADGTYPTLYVIGIATQDIANGQEGFITTYGKVRDLDTTGTAVGESWSIGDILYANPNYVGKLTKVKPTAPDNCIPIAAVLVVDAIEGEIFVRPTIDQRMIYGSFSDTTDQVPLAINTPYAITFDTTNISNGVTRGTPTSKIVVDQSGFYEIKVSLSLTSTNASAKAFFSWIRKNGVDVPYSARRKSVTGNLTYDILNMNFSISLNANEYIEIMYAVSDTTISINSPPATAFCPAIPSAMLKVTQVAL